MHTKCGYGRWECYCTAYWSCCPGIQSMTMSQAGNTGRLRTHNKVTSRGLTRRDNNLFIPSKTPSSQAAALNTAEKEINHYLLLWTSVSATALQFPEKTYPA